MLPGSWISKRQQGDGGAGSIAPVELDVAGPVAPAEVDGVGTIAPAKVEGALAPAEIIEVKRLFLRFHGHVDGSSG